MSALQRVRVLAVAAVLAASMMLVDCRSKAETSEGPVVTVDVAPVLTSQIQRTIRTDALLYPIRQAAIVPKITAPVKSVHVQRGDRVRAGQLLVELENQDLVTQAR